MIIEVVSHSQKRNTWSKRRVEIDPAMGLAAVQVQGHREDGDLGEDQQHCQHGPPPQAEHTTGQQGHQGIRHDGSPDRRGDGRHDGRLRCKLHPCGDVHRIAIRGTVHSWGPELSSLDPRASAADRRPPVAAAPLIELDRATVVRGQVSAARAQPAHRAGASPARPQRLRQIHLHQADHPRTVSTGAGRRHVAVKVLGQNRWQVDRLRSQLGIVTGDLSSNLADMPGLTVEQAVLSGFFASYVVPAFRR